MNKSKILKPILIILGYISIMVVVWLLLKYFKLDNITTLKTICNNGPIGTLLFVTLQIIQVVFLPLNSIIFTVPAIIIFGPLKAFLISYVGITIGSIIMFFVGRYGGLKIMSMLVGSNKAMHYANTLGKGKLLLPLFLLIAIFPDDILCVSAGLSNINFCYFFVVILITRAIDLIVTCFVGTIAIKSTLGIILIVLFVLTGILLSIVLTKKEKEIETWFVNIFAKPKHTKLKNKK